LNEALAGIMHHHERVDGTGYAMGFAGGEIPEFARAIAVAGGGRLRGLLTGAARLVSVESGVPDALTGIHRPGMGADPASQ
jgi:hypothetical protein